MFTDPTISREVQLMRWDSMIYSSCQEKSAIRRCAGHLRSFSSIQLYQVQLKSVLLGSHAVFYAGDFACLPTLIIQNNKFMGPVLAVDIHSAHPGCIQLSYSPTYPSKAQPIETLSVHATRQTCYRQRHSYAWVWVFGGRISRLAWNKSKQRQSKA